MIKPSNIVYDELKQRVKKLELEQHRQTNDLDSLSRFEEEIERFETKLKQINQYYQEAKKVIAKHESSETQRLEYELKQMQAEDKHYLEEIGQLKKEIGQVKNSLEELQTVATATTSTKLVQKSVIESDFFKLAIQEAMQHSTLNVTHPNTATFNHFISELSSPSVNVNEKAIKTEEGDVYATLELILSEEENNVVQVSGYVVCLTFNRNSPTEWSEESGGGWREAGRGQCYVSLEAAQECLAKLKQQWPDYPFKILRRD